VPLEGPALLPLLALSCLAATPDRATLAADAPLRIFAFGAHPDECELDAAGVAAKWAARGHKFECVALTKVDISATGAPREGPLALRRAGESQKAARILGIETEVLDNHDGELMVTLENRRRITRLLAATMLECRRPAGGALGLTGRLA
jgi:LmbE family N-acetylglucosaminyl deacetylase